MPYSSRLWHPIPMMKPIVFMLAAAAVFASPSTAQTPPGARLLVTVVDPSGGVIPGATVTIVGLDETAMKAAAAPAGKTAANGVATLGGLTPGRYSIQAEFEGFEPGVLKDVRVR